MQEFLGLFEPSAWCFGARTRTIRWCRADAAARHAPLGALAASARPAPIAHTSLGAVRGNALHDADEFLGLPYASAKRFQPAVPRSAPFDTSPLVATYYGPACKQVLSSTKNYGVEHGCHVLNIWRPAGTAAGAALPVLMPACTMRVKCDRILARMSTWFRSQS